MGFDMPGRTIAMLRVDATKLMLAGGQYEADESDIEGYKCVDCGFETSKLDVMLRHQERQTGHSLRLRLVNRLRRIFYRQPRLSAAGPPPLARPLTAEIKTTVGRKLSWRCHVCFEERPDALIGVRVRPRFMPQHYLQYAECDPAGVIFEQARYCNDRPACVAGVEKVAFVVGAIDMPDEKVIFTTEDAAMHRGFRKRGTYKLDPVDESVLQSAVEIVRLEAMIERALGEIDTHPERHPLPPGMNRLTKDGLMHLARQAPETYKNFLDAFRPAMDRETALLVRELRVDEGFSWRAVARWFSESAMPVLWATDGSNQLAGKALCELAAAVLGEDHLAGDWNVFP